MTVPNGEAKSAYRTGHGERDDDDDDDDDDDNDDNDDDDNDGDNDDDDGDDRENLPGLTGALGTSCSACICRAGLTGGAAGLSLSSSINRRCRRGNEVTLIPLPLPLPRRETGAL